MTPKMTFQDALSHYNLIHQMKDDLPDGMWDEVKEMAAEYRETDKTDSDKEWFVEELQSIAKEWGHSL